jgi:hypothetical protein
MTTPTPLSGGWWDVPPTIDCSLSWYSCQSRCAEEEAAARGCHGAWLDTFEFQARGFYERLGYTCFAELGDYPVGSS